MKYMIASDIHGSAWYCRKMMEALEKEQADRLILLGDLLYHGPRNDLPKEYAPKEVIRMLNKEKNRIYNVLHEAETFVLETPEDKLYDLGEAQDTVVLTCTHMEEADPETFVTETDYEVLRGSIASLLGE